jgi:dipeptidyl aminopeptidase/acylaminoacyl peptidase
MHRKSLLAILLPFLLLSACANAPATLSVATTLPTVTAQPSNTIMPSATATETPIPSATSTPIPSATATPSPSPTVKLPVQQGTKVPENRQVISRQNVEQLTLLATWDSCPFFSPILSFSQSGNIFAARMCEKQGVLVYNAENGQIILSYEAPEDYLVENVTLSPDGTMMAIAQQKNSPRYYRLKQEIHVIGIPGGQEIVNIIHPNRQAGYGVPSFSPDGSLIGFTSWDWVLSFWKVSDWSDVTSFKAVNSSELYFVDNEAVISIDWDHATLWEISSGKRLITYLDPKGVISADVISLSPSKDLLAIATNSRLENSAGIWRVSDGELLSRCDEDCFFAKMAFTPNDALLVTKDIVVEDQTRRVSFKIGVRDVQSGELLKDWTDGNGFAISPDGSLLVISQDDEIQWWGIMKP